MNITVGRQGGSPILYEINSNSPIPEALRNCQPDTVLKTSFKMDALIPVSPEEAQLLAPVATASPTPGVTPSPSTPPKK
jgi:predicted aconitase with swiveling domain